MAVDLASDLWSELKRFIGTPDRSEAADTVVNLLIDHDYDASDIKDAFKGDSDIKRALQTYLDDDSHDEDDEDYEDDDYEEDY